MKNYMNVSAPAKASSLMEQDRAKKKPTVSSSDQLAQMQRQAAKATTPEQEKAARDAGFKSHNEMSVYLEQKKRRVGGSVSGGKNKAKPAAPTSTTGNTGTGLMGYVARAFKGATDD